MGLTLELISPAAPPESYSNIENLIGSSFDDVLEGDAADNVLTGLDGSDNFVFDLNAGNDRVTDFVLGEDQIDLSAFGTDFAIVQADA